VFVSDFQKEIGKTLIQIQDDISELLRRTHASVSVNDCSENLDGAPSLPLETVDALSALNSWLDESNNNERLVKSYFQIKTVVESTFKFDLLNLF